jgi:hypothetical protein
MAPAGQLAVCTTGFGASLFTKANQTANEPHGLSGAGLPTTVPAEVLEDDEAATREASADAG